MYTCVSDLLDLLATPAQQQDPVRVIRRIQYAQHRSVGRQVSERRALQQGPRKGTWRDRA